MKVFQIIGIVAVVLMVVLTFSYFIITCEEVTEPEVIELEVVEPEPEPDPEPEPEPKLTSEEASIKMVIELLQSEVGDISEIYLDEENKIFTINPTSPDLVSAFIWLFDGDEDVRATYDVLVEELRLLSVSIATFLPEYAVAIQNPFNEDLLYVVAWDGEIVYNVMED